MTSKTPDHANDTFPPLGGRFEVIQGGAQDGPRNVLLFPSALRDVTGAKAMGALVDISCPYDQFAVYITRGLYEQALAHARTQVGDENTAVDLLAVILEGLIKDGIDLHAPDILANLREAIETLAEEDVEE